MVPRKKTESELAIEESNRRYRQDILDAAKVPGAEKDLELWLAGFCENRRTGRYHPPSCTASWPINEAYAMVVRDKAKGRHVISTFEELRNYHSEVGFTPLDRKTYDAEVKRLAEMKQARLGG